MGYGAVAGICIVILALATATAAYADDEESPQPGNPANPNPFVRSDVATPDLDPFVRMAPHAGNDKRVGAILAAHPDRDVLICLAGCGDGGPKVVSIRRPGAAMASVPVAQSNAPVVDRAHEMRPTSGKFNSRQIAVPEAGRPAEHDQPAVGDVICIAGCIGGAGEVVQTAVRLTWIDRSASEDLRSALRGLADRLLAQEAEAAALAANAAPNDRHVWMSDAARRMLVETPLPSTLAALVRSATALVETSPLRSP